MMHHFFGIWHTSNVWPRRVCGGLAHCIFKAFLDPNTAEIAFCTCCCKPSSIMCLNSEVFRWIRYLWFLKKTTIILLGPAVASCQSITPSRLRHPLLHNAAPDFSRSRRLPWWGWGRERRPIWPPSWAAPPVTWSPLTRTLVCFWPGSHSFDFFSTFLCSDSWLVSLQNSKRLPESFSTHPSLTSAEVSDSFCICCS